MKTVLLSTAIALGLGLFATAPSSAAPLPVQGLASPDLTSDVACRMVTKRVRRPNGAVQVTRQRVCDSRPMMRNRADRRGRPGITVRVR